MSNKSNRLERKPEGQVRIRKNKGKKSENPALGKSGRIRTRSTVTSPKESTKDTCGSKSVRRASPSDRERRLRGDPKPGRDYKPLVYAKNGMRIDDLEHDVGYSKAPDAGKFKPGQSGNPKGRPKGAKGLKTLLNNALKQKVIFSVNGKKKKITTREGIIMRLTKKALDGDLNALKLILSMQENIEFLSSAGGVHSKQDDYLDEADAAIIDEFIRQIEESSTESELEEELDEDSEHPNKGGDDDDA